MPPVSLKKTILQDQQMFLISFREVMYLTFLSLQERTGEKEILVQLKIIADIMGKLFPLEQKIIYSKHDKPEIAPHEIAEDEAILQLHFNKWRERCNQE